MFSKCLRSRSLGVSIESSIGPSTWPCIIRVRLSCWSLSTFNFGSCGMRSHKLDHDNLRIMIYHATSWFSGIRIHRIRLIVIAKKMGGLDHQIIYSHFSIWSWSIWSSQTACGNMSSHRIDHWFGQPPNPPTLVRALHGHGARSISKRHRVVLRLHLGWLECLARCGKSWKIFETIGKMNENDLYMLDFLDLDSTEGKWKSSSFKWISLFYPFDQ